MRAKHDGWSPSASRAGTQPTVYPKAKSDCGSSRSIVTTTREGREVSVFDRRMRAIRQSSEHASLRVARLRDCSTEPGEITTRSRSAGRGPRPRRHRGHRGGDPGCSGLGGRSFGRAASGRRLGFFRRPGGVGGIVGAEERIVLGGVENVVEEAVLITHGRGEKRWKPGATVITARGSETDRPSRSHAGRSVPECVQRSTRSGRFDR